MTKKKFTELHKSRKIKLLTVYSKSYTDSKARIDGLQKTEQELYTFSRPVTNVNVQDQRATGLTITIHQHGRIIYLETEINSSKDYNCSWDDTSYSTIIYVMEWSKMTYYYKATPQRIEKCEQQDIDCLVLYTLSTMLFRFHHDLKQNETIYGQSSFNLNPREVYHARR